MVALSRSAAVMTDIISGQVDLFFGTETSAGPFIKEGKMKAVAGTLSTNNAFLWVLPPPGVLPVLVLGGVVAARRRRR